MGRKLSVLLIIVALLFTFVACDSEKASESEPQPVKVTLTAQTDLPTVGITWKYTATPKDGTASAETALTDGATQDLAQGTYTFVLNGYIGTELIYSGSKTDVQISDTLKAVTIPVTLAKKNVVVVDNNLKFYDTLDKAVESLKTATNKTATFYIFDDEVTLGNVSTLLGETATATKNNITALSKYNITFVGLGSSLTKVNTRTVPTTTTTGIKYNDARGANLTFKNMTVSVGVYKGSDSNYSGQGIANATSLTMENCKIEGYAANWGKKNTFNNCTFESPKDWCIDVIEFGAYVSDVKSVDVTYIFKGCTFSSGTGEFIDVYHTCKDSTCTTKYNITVEDCTFNNTWASGTEGLENSNRAAVFIKTKVDTGEHGTNCELTFKGTNTYNGTFDKTKAYAPDDNSTYKAGYTESWQKLFAVVDKDGNTYSWDSKNGNVTVKNGETVLFKTTASTSGK